MFSTDIVPSFVATLRVLVKSNFSTEVVRALATFVTSTSHKGLGSPCFAADVRERKINDHLERNELACQKDLCRGAGSYESRT
jgi:hypothetical protein